MSSTSPTGPVEWRERELGNHVLTLRIAGETTGLAPGAIRAGLLAARGLTAIVQTTLAEPLHASPLGRVWITADNPYLSSADRERLDSEGLIRPGETISEGNVLASILAVSGKRRGTQTPVRDQSWRLPAGWDDAQVVAVRRESSQGRRREFPVGVLEYLSVRLRREIPFSLGDSLEVAGHVFATTVALADDELPRDETGAPADVVVPARIAEVFRLEPGQVTVQAISRVAPAVVDRLVARSTGAYSLISAAPLARRSKSRGVAVGERQLGWLHERGWLGVLSELVGLRCDDLQNRPLLRAFARGEGTLTALAPAASETALRVQEQLWALGVAVTTSSGDGCVHVRLRPASDAEVIARSHGEVRKPETLDRRTYLPTRQGLFCEEIFGPEGSPLRRRRAGHVALEAPVAPLLWRLGRNPILAEVLGLKREELESIVSRHATVSVQDGQLGLERREPGTLPPQGESCLGTGCEALRSLLRRLPPESIPSSFGAAGERFFTQTLAVLPPDLRPLVLLGNGNLAMADVNDLYRLVINHNNRLRKLRELNAPAIIIDSDTRELQHAVDQLIANSRLPAMCQARDSEDRPLMSLSELLTGPLAAACDRWVEWAGEARCVAKRDLRPREVEIPALIFDTLRLDESTPVLLTSARGPFVARRPLRVDGPVIRLHASDVEALRDDDGIVAVHRPLTPAAVDEAQRMMRGETLEGPTTAEAPGDWCAAEGPEEIMDALIAAAVRGEELPLRSVRGIAVFGTGAVSSTLSELSADRSEAVLSLTLPAEPPRPTPTLEEMADVVRRHARPSCLFRLRRADSGPPPEAGRIGGLPWLPRGSVWPLGADGEPCVFVGQLPLDPAREAGLLPFHVAPGAMLTVFCRGDWNAAASVRDGTILMHGTRDLEQLVPPASDYPVASLCALIPEIAETYPSVDEALRIVDWELEHPSNQALHQLRAHYEELFDNHRDASRVGGHPHWVQDVASDCFVAQFNTDNDETDLNLGDAGSLYVQGNAPDELQGFVQSY